MKPEKQQLIEDLLNADPQSEAILSAGSQILRRRRRWRVASRVIMVGLVLCVAGFSVSHMTRQTSAEVAKASVAKSAPVERTELSDDELLALFPDTAVGLVTLSDGTKRLIFPRPGDQEKYITRL